MTLRLIAFAGVGLSFAMIFAGAIAAFAVVPVLTPLWRAVRPAR